MKREVLIIVKKERRGATEWVNGYCYQTDNMYKFEQF